jgi:hypothetical protein
MDADRRQYRKDYMHNYLQQWRTAAKAADPEEYREKRSKYNKSRDQDKYRAGVQSSRANARAAEKYRCDDCDKNFANPSELIRHNLTKKHLAVVANKAHNGGVYKPPPPLKCTKRAQEARAAKKHFCSTCNLALGSAAALREHHTTPTHLKKEAALLEAASSLVDSQ